VEEVEVVMHNLQVLEDQGEEELVELDLQLE
jgi:hypothetical protein